MDNLFIPRQEYLGEYHPEYTLVRMSVHDITQLNNSPYLTQELLDYVPLYFETMSVDILSEHIGYTNSKIIEQYIVALNTYLETTTVFNFIETPVLDNTDWLYLPSNFACVDNFLTTNLNNSIIVVMEYTDEHANSRFKK